MGNKGSKKDPAKTSPKRKDAAKPKKGKSPAKSKPKTPKKPKSPAKSKPKTPKKSKSPKSKSPKSKKPTKPKSKKPKKKCCSKKKKKPKPKKKKPKPKKKNKKKCCECCKKKKKKNKKKCCKCCKKKKKPIKKQRKPCPPKPLPLPSLDVLKCTQYFIVKRNLEPISRWEFFKTVKPGAIFDDALKLDIYDNCGCRLLIAIEVNDSCSLCFCETDRTTNFIVLDTCGNHLFTITRGCDFCCFLGVVFCRDGIGQNMQINLGNQGPLIGTTTQQCPISGCCCKPLYHVRNAEGVVNFRVSGHCNGFCFCRRISCPDQFLITSQLPSQRLGKRRRQLGKISSVWPTLTKEKFQNCQGDSDVLFGAKFPKDADVKLKATILGLIILINFHHYAHSPCPIWRTLTCCIPRLCCLGF